MLREKLRKIVDQYEKPLKVGLYLVAILLMAGIIWVRADAPPDTISYQGYLTDASGTPVNNSVNMNIAFYGAVTGGLGLYAEDHANVTVSRGQFDLELGAGTPTVGTWGALDFSQALWMEITVGGETFFPRIPLSAVPYARFAFYTGALAANGANCSSGQAPLGVDASGAAENCFDVATQTELDTHSNLTTAHSATSSNTANRIVMRDGSGDFSAGTITANLTGNVAGNASTATALAANGSNCAAGNYPLGVDASGNAEGCTAAGGGSITAKVGVSNVNAATITVSCPSGTTVAVGGGCRSTGAGLYNTEPSCGGGGGSCSDGGTNMNGWFCEWNVGHASNTAYVICY